MKRFNLEREELPGQWWGKGTIICLRMLKGLEKNWASVEIMVEGRGK